MADWYISSVEYAARTAWSASAIKAVGALVRPTAPSAGNERTYRASSITTGITAGSEPSWPLTAGSTVVDGGVTWTEVSGNSTYAPQSAAAHVDVIFTQTNGRGAVDGTDWMFVDSNHVEPTWTSARDWTRAGKTRVVTWSGMSIPPIPSNMSSGTLVLQTSGASNMVLSGNPDFDGFYFYAGSLTNQAHVQIGRTASVGTVTIRNGYVKLNNSNSASRINLGSVSSGSLRLENTPVEFGHASQQFSMAVANGYLTWLNTSGAIQGTAPTALLASNFVGSAIHFENVDLSAISGTLVTAPSGSNTWYGTFRAINCRLHASVTKASNWKLRSLGDILEFIGCDDSTSNKISKIHKATISGEISTTYTEYNTATATPPEGSSFSFKAVQSASANGPPTRAGHNVIDLGAVWNTLTSSRTASVEVAVEHTAMLDHAAMWLEIIYHGASGNPLKSSATNRVADAPAGTPTAGTASSAAWTAALRTNSENPTAGSIRRVSSNTNRIFVVQTAGAFSGSLPGEYATMVDGDTITDGAATLRAMFRQTVSVTFTPARLGLIEFKLHIVHPSTTQKIVLVDPHVTLS